MSAEIFANLQTRAVALLDAGTYFSDIAVIEVSDGTIATRIPMILCAQGLSITDGAKTVRRGLSVVVGVHHADVRDSQRLRFVPTLRCAVFESPNFNVAVSGVRKAGLDVCVEVFKLLHNQPALAGQNPHANAPRILATEQNALQRIGLDEQRSTYSIQGGNAWHCNFTVNSLAVDQTQTQ
jgi:hypothetical protein